MMSNFSRLDANPEAKAAYLASEARAAIALAAVAIWACLRQPRALFHLLSALLRIVPRRRSLVDLTPAEVAALRALLAE